VKTLYEEVERKPLSKDCARHVARPESATTANRLFEAYCRFVLAAYCPLRVEGRHHIPKTSFIFCSNHCSHMDSSVLMASSGRPFNDFAMIAAKDYFFQGARRADFLGRMMNLIPLDRDPNQRTLKENLQLCRDFVQDGRRCLIIYPEGTRSPGGEMQPFKKGVAMFATALKLPIVPAYIEGTFRRWPKGSRFIKPGPVRCHIGAPIQPEGFSGNGNGNGSGMPSAVYRRITQELEDSVLRLREDCLRAK